MHDRSAFIQDTGELIDVISRVMTRPTTPQQRTHEMMRHAQRMLGRKTLSMVLEFSIEDPQRLQICNSFITPGKEHDPKAIANFASQSCTEASQPYADKILPLVFRQPNSPVSAIQSQLVGDEADWRDSDLRRCFFQPLGYNDGIMSMYWNDVRNRLYIAGVFSGEEDGPFTDRQFYLGTQMFRATLPMITEDFFDTQPAAELTELTGKQREVLRLALTGLSEKQIAARMHRSAHTVHVHLREIYRRLEVSSRAELMARFIDHAALEKS